MDAPSSDVTQTLLSGLVLNNPLHQHGGTEQGINKLKSVPPVQPVFLEYKMIVLK